MLTSSAHEIGEDDALCLEIVGQFMVCELAIDKDHQSALLVAYQRFKMLGRDLFQAGLGGDVELLSLVPVDVTVISAPPFLFEVGHGQAFIESPGLAAEIAHPGGVLQVLAERFNIGPGVVGLDLRLGTPSDGNHELYAPDEAGRTRAP